MGLIDVLLSVCFGDSKTVSTVVQWKFMRQLRLFLCRLLHDCQLCVIGCNLMVCVVVVLSGLPV